MKHTKLILIIALMFLSFSLFAVNDMGKGGSYDGAAMHTSGIISMGNVTLPVTLSSFSAIQTSADFAQLNWTTQSETNLLGYNVYRNTNDSNENSLKMNRILISGNNTSSEQNYEFIDEEVSDKTEYYYWLESVDLDGSIMTFGPTVITILKDEQPGEETPEIIINAGIQSIYPNPFNPQTTISYYLKESSNVTIEIYNTKGQKITSLNEGSKEAERMHSLIWNGKNSSQENVGSGIYFFKLKAGKLEEIKQAILLK